MKSKTFKILYFLNQTQQCLNILCPQPCLFLFFVSYFAALCFITKKKSLHAFIFHIFCVSSLITVGSYSQSGVEGWAQVKISPRKNTVG